MEVVINDKSKLLSASAISKTRSRSNASFARFGYNVKLIEITVQDVNGPRGGVDKQCRVMVKLNKLNDVVVAVKDESLSKAIPSAINRAARSVSRLLDRRAIRDRGRVSRFSFEM